MPSEQEHGILVKVIPEAERLPFRLLELPPELVDVLRKGRSSVHEAPIFELKSKPNTEGDSRDGNVVLCTRNATYNVRQVSTSNSVFITQPCKSEPGVEAIAQCDSTIELLSITAASAVPYLKSMLPVYTSTGNHGTVTATSKDQLFADIPLSTWQCEQAWLDLGCFESTDPQGCFIPSANVKAEAWAVFFTAACAAGLPFPAVFSEFFVGDKVIFNLDTDWPHALIWAVMMMSCEKRAEGLLAFKKDKCVCSTGLSLLEARCTGGKKIPLAEFVAAWKHVLPKPWRRACTLEKLGGHHAVVDNGESIVFVPEGPGADGAGRASGEEEPKPSGSRKRNWHERFRASKKA